MTDPKGLLLVLVDPAPTMEEELNDWYDTEHLPERRAVPGFETARRFTSLGDGPRYAAIYDLASLEVLRSPAYLAVSGENFSPWTRRVTGRSRPLRITARQVLPGDRPTGRCARLLLLRFGAVAGDGFPGIIEGLTSVLAPSPGLLQWRLFACEEPDPTSAIAIIEFAGPVPPLNLAGIGAGASNVDMVAAYRPYRA